MGTSRRADSWTAVVWAVAARPVLWATAVGQVFRLSPTGWWRRPPFVPRPDPAYVRFRVATQYGGSGSSAAPSGVPGPSSGVPGPSSGVPGPHDVVEYLRWCRSLGARPMSRPSRR